MNNTESEEKQKYFSFFNFLISQFYKRFNGKRKIFIEKFEYLQKHSNEYQEFEEWFIVHAGKVLAERGITDRDLIYSVLNKIPITITTIKEEKN